jgi:hypothetical protein
VTVLSLVQLILLTLQQLLLELIPNSNQNGNWMFCQKTVTVTKNIPTNKWSGGKWSISSGPSLEQDLVFEENFDSIMTVDGVVEGCSCLVKSAKAVVFNPGHSLIIKNNVTVNGP